MTAAALDATALAGELARQQALVRAILRDPVEGQGDDMGREPKPWAAVPPWQGPAARVALGLRAYRGNAGALAERALAAVMPTVQQLLGPESFAALARAHWHAAPPQCGDLAQFGRALPDAVAVDPQLVSEPYLADCARLDWAVSRAETAADALADPASVALLGESDPASLQLRLRPGTTVLSSPHPIVSIWLAHHHAGGETRRAVHRAAAREALASGRGETAVVWRDGWRVRVGRLDGAETSSAPARFTAAVGAGCSLERALHDAGDGFDVSAWLIQSLRDGWLLGVHRVAA